MSSALGERGRAITEFESLMAKSEVTEHSVIAHGQDGGVRAVLNGVLANEGYGGDPAEGYIASSPKGWPVFYRNIETKVLSN